MVTFRRLALPLLAMVVAILLTPKVVDPCRTDPIFTFTDGSRVTVTVSVDAAASTIKQLDYQLHVPHGLVVESYAVIDDQPPNSYSVAILISDTGHAAMSSVLEANGKRITGSGTTGTPLHLHAIRGGS